MQRLKSFFRKFFEFIGLFIAFPGPSFWVFIWAVGEGNPLDFLSVLLLELFQLFLKIIQVEGSPYVAPALWFSRRVALLFFQLIDFGLCSFNMQFQLLLNSNMITNFPL